MIRIEENGIIVDFPDDNVFQFQECPAYRNISSQSVKEMDVCWWEAEQDILWCVELKAFDNPQNIQHQAQDLGNKEIVDYWIEELYKKSVHTLCLLESNRANTKECRVDGISDRTRFKLIYLINTINGQEHYLQFIQRQLQQLLRPYLAIFKVSSVAVIPYSLARNDTNYPSWIV